MKQWHAIVLYLAVGAAALFGLFNWVIIPQEASEAAAIHNEGRRAAEDGLPPTACPYPQTVRHQMSYQRWMRGYGEAAREQRQAKGSPR